VPVLNARALGVQGLGTRKGGAPECRWNGAARRGASTVLTQRVAATRQYCLLDRSRHPRCTPAVHQPPANEWQRQWVVPWSPSVEGCSPTCCRASPDGPEKAAMTIYPFLASMPCTGENRGRRGVPQIPSLQCSSGSSSVSRVRQTWRSRKDTFGDRQVDAQPGAKKSGPHRLEVAGANRGRACHSARHRGCRRK
jgi:hypothetical protein